MENITVTFDEGYLNHFTKDTTHFRRSNGKQGRRLVPAIENPPADKISGQTCSKA